jgi:hypothetical protein
MNQEFDSELQSRVNALSLSKMPHAPMVDMLDESNKENLLQLNEMGGRRSLQANTANMIKNRSSLSSDDE